MTKEIRGQKWWDKIKQIINGERINTHGDPEDSFWLIADRWTQYLINRGYIDADSSLQPKDVAFMLADMKMARECSQEHPDNIVDCGVYLAIYHDITD